MNADAATIDSNPRERNGPRIDPPASMRRDVTSAYVAAGSRIGAWAIVSAIVYRLAGPDNFGTLALIRGAIGILNYTSVGLAPALIRSFAQVGVAALGARASSPAFENQERARTPAPPNPKASSFVESAARTIRGELENFVVPPAPSPAETREDRARPPPRAPAALDIPSLSAYPIQSPHGDADGGAPQSNERFIYSTGMLVAAISAAAGLVLAILYALVFDRLHVVPPTLLRQAPWAVLLIAIGTLLRLFSDVSGALLQTRGRIALDNYLLAASDASWALLTIVFFHMPGLLTASLTYAAAGIFLVIARSLAVARLNSTPAPPRLASVRLTILRPLLAFGSLVLLAQLAEYFYAPTDYILINHFFGPTEVAAYAPAVQIDMGLLMLVTGLAAVLLPKAALAHGAGDTPVVRRYYIRGTLASVALLTLAATAVWIFSPILLRIWFGNHPPATRQILDLVLIGTVVGGSSAVGRSILIGVGKIKAFTAAALLAGVVNVIASYCFVKYAGLGLRGILYGTVIAVVGRCAIWMPWYVMVVLRKNPINYERLESV